MDHGKNWLGAMLCLAMACDDGDFPRASDTDDESATAPDPSAASQGEGSEETASAGDTAVSETTPGSDGDPSEGSDDGQDDTEGDDDDDDDGDETGGPQGGDAGMLFTLGNADDHNEVIAYHRTHEGRLEHIGAYLTGGAGNGGGLGSQGSIAIGADEHLYVVNAGDGTISSMRIFDDHLALEDLAQTGGTMPTSLVLGEEVIYVLNAGGAGSVAGFGVDEGMFWPIEGASQPLSGHEAPAPAQIGITPDGKSLVVTERATNYIVTYAVENDGSLGEPVVNMSEGVTPFGFDFTTTGVFVVSEAFGGGMNPGASAASSYRVADGGALWNFTASAPNGQTAACWIEIVRDQYAYSTNTGSSTISGYHVDEDGTIELFNIGGALVDLGDDQGPLDMAASADENFLYVLNGAGDNIVGFSIDDDGTLRDLDEVTDVPQAAAGLAAF